MSAESAPVTLQPAERLPALDLARGLALLGVGAVNVISFASIWSSVHALDLARHWADVVAEYTVALAFIHRCYPLLGFLFGVGLAWQWQRQPEPRTTAALRPRLWALLLIGIGHALLLWPGDVLSTYAILGLGVAWLAGAPAPRLRRWLFGAYLFAALLYGVLGAAMMQWASPPRPVVESTSSFAQTSLMAALALHPREFLERGITQTLAPDFWAHVIFGIWAARTGALQHFLGSATADASWRRRLHLAGATLLLAGSVVELMAAARGGWDALTERDAGYGLMTLAAVPVSIGAIWAWLAVARWWAGTSGSALRDVVMVIGRAPLTQFIGQSLVFSVLFNDSLLGLHGDVGRAGSLAIAVVTWLVIGLLTARWLAHGYAHGPLELAWRALTARLSPPPDSSASSQPSEHRQP